MGTKKHLNALGAGYKLHWYKIKSVLGRGGFGITYLAEDTNLDRLVAIKEFLPVDLVFREDNDSIYPIDDDDRDQYRWGLERFLSEAQTLVKFDHPNIVKVIAVFEENNTGYMIMPYEKGEELATLIKRKKVIDEYHLLQIANSLLDGLEKVHDSGFIHRDIKPQNILIREDGSPLLIDFGSARQAIGNKTKTLTTMITPGYAPFEQYYSKSDKQGPWSDIYSLAATLYRCVVGRLPINAVDRSESILENTGDVYISAQELGKGHYSKHFLKAIDHGLAFKPKDRPQSVTQWKAEFKKVKRPKRLFYRDEKDIPTERNESIGDRQYSNVINKKKTTNKLIYLPVLVASLCLIVFGITIFQWDYVFDTFLADMSDKTNETVVLKDNIKIQPSKEELERIQLNEAISNLLKQANSELSGGYLYKPDGANAIEHFRNVLLIDPENENAIEGMRIVSSKLIKLIDKALENKKIDESKLLYKQLEIISKDVNELATVLKKINSFASKLEKERVAEQNLQQIKLENEKQNELVSSLLLSAKNDFDSLRLSSPKGNNALEKYREILTIALDNREAKEGIQNIVDKYIEIAKENSERKKYERAFSLLEQAQTISPDAENIEFIRNEIINLQTEDEALRLTLEEEKLAEQKRLEEANLKRLTEERKLVEVEASKQADVNVLSEESATARHAYNSEIGEFVKIPGGTFAMSGQSVTVETFEMGKYEVTQEQWLEIMGNNPSQLKNCSNCPVDNVSWKDVQTFIKKLNSDVEDKYRLPTTAEWVYACFKGGYQSECKGNNLDAINVVNRGSPRQVIQEPVNKIGLHGLNSYTWEWTCSEYTSEYSSKWLTCENVGKNFIPAIRGGKISQIDPSAKRYLEGYNSAYSRFQNIGFRLVVSK